jgi:tRNA-dihydrouridine synthase 2
MRSTEKARWEELTEIVQVVKSITDIPVIVNGDVFQWSDIAKAKEITSKSLQKYMLETFCLTMFICVDADSVMIARGAQWSPSAFRKEGLLPFAITVREYIKKVKKYTHNYEEDFTKNYNIVY